MQKVVVTQSLTTLRALTPDELDVLCKEAAKTVKEAKDSADFSRASNPMTGKVICVLEERLNKAKAEKTIASNTSLAKYWEGITGSKMPNHAMTCAVAFGTFVRCELVTEKDYDLCSANVLELAGAISNAVNGEVGHAAVTQAAEQLKERGKDATKKLRAILKEVKPPKPMDADTAQEMLKKIFADGHLKLVIAEAAAEMCYLDGQEAKESYFALIAAGCLVDKHFGETADAWLAEHHAHEAKKDAAKAPITLITEANAARSQTEAAQLQAA
jgi:hypothetical protein